MTLYLWTTLLTTQKECLGNKQLKKLLDIRKNRNHSDSFRCLTLSYGCNCLYSAVFGSGDDLGALFRDVVGNTLELSVTDRIWELILDSIL